jgi:hypothetical protein
MEKNCIKKAIFYYGTDLEDAKRIEVGISEKRYGDLGPGFYLTSNVYEAIEWAKYKTNITKKRPVVIKWFFYANDFVKLKTYEFFDDDDLYIFIRETQQAYQSRLLNFDIIKSTVRMPYSGRSGSQIKFQSDIAMNLLEMARKTILLIPERWANELTFSHKIGENE